MKVPFFSSSGHDVTQWIVFRTITGVLVFSLIMGPLGCARQRIVPVHTQEEALAAEVAKAERMESSKSLRRDQVDQWLRVATLALDAGKPELAREKLIDATSVMMANSPWKDFEQQARKSMRTFGGKEKQKYFLGDPYEQLLAHLYLGILDFQAGDYEYAKAMFRAASLMDQGSKEEGYKSDCYLAFLLEGIACCELGQADEADQAFQLAHKAFGFRQSLPLLMKALYQALGDMMDKSGGKDADLKRLDAMFPLVVSCLPLCVVMEPDTRKALASAFDAARAAVLEPPKDSPAKRFTGVLGGKKGERAERAQNYLSDFENCTNQCLSEADLKQAAQVQEEFGKVITAYRDKKINTLIIEQMGLGPAKIRAGKYGNKLLFRPYVTPARRIINVLRPVDGNPASYLSCIPFPGEAVTYQARTRGGREVDRILKKKAEFRDAMQVTASIAAGASVSAAASAAVVAATTAACTATVTTTATTTATTVAASSAASSSAAASSSTAATTTTTTTTSTAGASSGAMAATGILLGVAVAMIIIMIAAMSIANATHPEADIRAWHEVPDCLMFSGAFVTPGEYEMTSTFYDMCGLEVPGSLETVRFNVAPDRTTLLLSGRPWKPPLLSPKPAVRPPKPERRRRR